MNTWMATLVPYVYALGWSLLHFLWQGALIGLLYLLLRGGCSGSAARHRLGMSCLLAMLACPLATLALLWPEPGTAIAVSAAASSPVAAAGAVAGGAGLPADLERLLPWCVGVWLLGVCMIALRSFLHWRHLARTVRSATALPRDWQLRLIELSQRFGILRPVRLLSSARVTAPTLIGWLKPTILLPVSLLSGFTPAQIELILAHELAHVRRFDYIANLVQVVIETLLFYHPAVHWISSDVRQQREQCCDDLVLSVGGGQRLAYARTLADLEEWIQDEASRGFGTAMPALGAGGGVLLARVRRIVDPLDAQRALPRGGGFTLPMLLACAGLLLALLRLNAPAAEAVGAALVRASATSAELLAAATFHIRSNAPVLALAAKPAIAVPPLPRVADRESEPLAPPLPPSKAADVAVPRAAAVPVREETPASPPAAPSTPTPVADAAPAPAPIAKVDTPPVPVVAKDSPPAPAVAGPTPPQPLRVVQPSYPLDALRNNVEGKVELEFRIGEDGRVRDVRVLSAAPVGVFDQAAILALRQWRFAETPAPTATRYTRSFAFTRGAPPAETCRETTGSHICRRADAEGASN